MIDYATVIHYINNKKWLLEVTAPWFENAIRQRNSVGMQVFKNFDFFGDTEESHKLNIAKALVFSKYGRVPHRGWTMQGFVEMENRLPDINDKDFRIVYRNNYYFRRVWDPYSPCTLTLCKLERLDRSVI